MRRLKELLVVNYIGAIVIGVVSTQGLTSLIGALLTAIEWPFLRRAGLFETRPFPAEQFWRGFAYAAAYIGVAYFLLRWLYIEPAEQDPIEAADEEQEGLIP